jgi:chitinase
MLRILVVGVWMCCWGFLGMACMADDSQDPFPVQSSSSVVGVSSAAVSSSAIVYSSGAIDVGKKGILRDHYKVVGYLPSYSSHPDPGGLPTRKTLSHLTHVMYFNVGLLDTFGNVDLAQLRTNLRIRAVRDSAHAVGTKILLVVGGANVSVSQFGRVAANPTARALFAEQLVTFAQELNLDGIDIDWEFPNDLVGENFRLMLKAVKDRMAGTNLELSIAVHPMHVTYKKLYTQGFCENVDFIGLMGYDLGIPHAPIYTVDDLAKWEAQTGCPRSKLVLGVPFYGKIQNSPKNYMTWAQLMAAGCEFWSDQCATGHDYNGIFTITTKAKEVVKGNWGGIMIWDLNQDLPITDARSLLLNLSTVLPPN